MKTKYIIFFRNGSVFILPPIIKSYRNNVGTEIIEMKAFDWLNKYNPIIQ